MRLIIGPTCGGKSTYIQQMLAADATDGSAGEQPRVHFGFSIKEELEGEVPTGDDDVVHYNLLHSFQRKARRPPVTLAGDTMLEGLLDAATEVVVVSAPRSVLLERACARTHAEPDHDVYDDRVYYQDEWIRALESPDLAQIYEYLALMLDERGILAHCFCSNVAVHGELRPMPSRELSRLAADDADAWCRKGHAGVDPQPAGGSYQRDVRVGAVSATLTRALRMPLAGRTLLDIGCAEGEVSLSAARMGARVTGIDPRPHRLAAARRTAEALDLDVDLRQLALDQLLDRPRSYDVVVALNVAHHVSDPFAFLERAAALSDSHLVLEYPGLHDTKFGATLHHPDGLREEQPLVGVSLREQDQSFVFTPAALERYLLDILSVFRTHRVVESPIPHRWVSVFSGRKRPATRPGPTLAQLQKRVQLRDRALRRRDQELEQRGQQLDKRERQLARRDGQLAERDRQIAALQQQLRDMETSRSWRVTAPLRAVSDRARPPGRRRRS